jgi:hypothetical protein
MGKQVFHASPACSSLLPPPLWGRVGEGSAFGCVSKETPLPTALGAVGLPHKGGGNTTGSA